VRFQGEFQNTKNNHKIAMLKTIYKKTYIKKNVTSPPRFFSVSSCFGVLLGGVGSEIPRKAFQQKGDVDFFIKNIDPDLFLVLPSVFIAFLDFSR
jgi:hypothetical protein